MYGNLFPSPETLYCKGFARFPEKIRPGERDVAEGSGTGLRNDMLPPVSKRIINNLLIILPVRKKKMH